MIDLFLKALEDSGLSYPMDATRFLNIVEGISEEDFSFNYFYGVSRGVIVPKDYDWVIKIPFASDEEEGEYKIFFSLANGNPRHCWDYCFTETFFYHKAKKEGLHQVFCKEKYITSINGCPVYIQQKATPQGGNLKDHEPTEESKSKVREKIAKDKLSPFNIFWQANALDYYGEVYFNKLMNFLHDSNIHRDLHKDNIGYIGDKPVIFDYSDFIG